MNVTASNFVKRTLLGAVVICCCSISAYAQTTATKKVFFKNLKDGEKVSSPVKVEMGVQGMKIAPAGAVVAGEGHHHIIVDGGPVAKGQVIPADATHLHFGKGQTEAQVPLSPGTHTLTLQFADGLHQSYGPEMAATVSIDVISQSATK
jgi:hypothetical protein